MFGNRKEQPIAFDNTAEFDIEGKDILCIERRADEYGIATIISWRNNSKEEYEEEYLYTSDHCHQDFITRFKNKLMKRRK